MIIVRVELWSAVTGEITELARCGIDNVSGGGRIRSYCCRTWRGRSRPALDAAMKKGDDPKVVTRSGKVQDHRALDLHVWHLVAKALAAMGYGSDK